KALAGARRYHRPASARPPRSRHKSFPGSSRESDRFRASELPFPEPARSPDLALVELEIDDLPGLGLFSGQLLLDFSPELLFRHLASPVQPGCTIELLPIPPSCQLR